MTRHQIHQSKHQMQPPPQTNLNTLENTLNTFMTQTSAYMANTNRFIQKVGVFMEKTEMRMQSNEASLKSLENQVGQFAQILRTRPIGGLPRNTEVAKTATHEQCKEITTRSGKQLKEVHAEKEQYAVESSATTATPQQCKDKKTNKEEAPKQEEHIDEEPQHAESPIPPPTKEILEISNPPPPFPRG